MNIREALRTCFHEVAPNYFVQNDLDFGIFEREYLALRDQENRLYPDEVVKKLPTFHGPDHLVGEWNLRSASSSRLTNYVVKNNFKSIMEVGAGNGWLSHRLALTTNAEILAADVNRKETEQGARVFSNVGNLTFLCCDISSWSGRLQFDAIILASCLQYFKDPESFLAHLFTFLTMEGEIHIIDTPFYAPSNVEAARIRSGQYFASYNSQMGNYYHHHTLDKLRLFKCDYLYNPHTMSNLIRRRFMKLSPFPWLRLKRPK